MTAEKIKHLGLDQASENSLQDLAQTLNITPEEAVPIAIQLAAYLTHIARGADTKLLIEEKDKFTQVTVSDSNAA